MSYEFNNPATDPLNIGADGRPVYGMGLLPSPADRSAILQYGAVHDTIPDADWRPIDYGAAYPLAMFNQARHGSCVGQSTNKAATRAWHIGGGTPHTFSPTFTYAHINGGRDAGASILAALESIKRDGTCFFEENDQDHIYKNQIDPKCYTTAKRFVGWKGYAARSRKEFASGIQRGFMGVGGVTVGGAFQAYRGQGCVSCGWGPANHAIHVRGMALVGGKWVWLCDNSWGEAWGDQGRFQLAFEDLHEDEMFLVEAPPTDPQETLIPPHVRGDFA